MSWRMGLGVNGKRAHTFQLDRQTQKSRSELKILAKKGDVKSARILAREVVRANKQKDRLMSSQARMKSIQMQLQHQLCESTLVLRGRSTWLAALDHGRRY